MLSTPQYSSLLSRSYWRDASACLTRPLNLAVAALLAAMSTVINLYVMIPVADNLNIMLQYVPTAIMAMICGPWTAILFGVVTDILDFVLHGWGFFPGYTLSSVLGAVIYALFLFRSRITVVRVLLARLTVNLLVNVALGSLWSAMMSGRGYGFYFTASLVKNLILLPVEVLALLAVLRLLMPAMSQLRLIPQQSGRRIALI